MFERDGEMTYDDFTKKDGQSMFRESREGGVYCQRVCERTRLPGTGLRGRVGGGLGVHWEIGVTWRSGLIEQLLAERYP